MTKENKKGKSLLVIAALLLVVFIGIGTYAIYRSTASGTATVSTANWSVKINNADMETKTFTFNNADISWTSNPGKNGKIAPGAKGTITLELDATGSEVDVAYTATVKSIKIGGTAVTGDDFTVKTKETTDAAGTITYNADSMKKTITLEVTWNGADSDTTTKDTADKAMAGKDVEIEVEVTAKQSL